MKKVTLNRSMRIGGRLYRTGDAASVSRANARVLVAVGHANNFVEKPAVRPAPKLAPTPTPPAAHHLEFSGTHAQGAPTHDHHEAHQEARTAQGAVKATAKATPVAKRPTGQKVEK